MKLVFVFLLLLSNFYGLTQNHKGIAFQAVARSNEGVVLPNKKMQVKISILTDTNEQRIVYQEIKVITTNALGMFSVIIGVAEAGKIATMGKFENINWSSSNHFIRIEIDFDNHLQFIRIGQQQINYVAYAFSADHVMADKVEGVLNMQQGGTGVTSIPALKLALQIDKVNNIPDSSKVISKQTMVAINNKLDKKDTASLSYRINQKLTKGEISALEITSSLGFSPFEMHFGAFADTNRQFAIANAATAIKWRDTLSNHQLFIGVNSSFEPTRIVVVKEGVYVVQYSIQVANPLIANDEISIWIRRNGAGYANSLRQFLTGAIGVKNIFSGQAVLPIGAGDYIELYYSVRNSQTQLLKTNNLTNPARPATPSAQIIMYRIK